MRRHVKNPFKYTWSMFLADALWLIVFLTTLAKIIEALSQSMQS